MQTESSLYSKRKNKDINRTISILATRPLAGNLLLQAAACNIKVDCIPFTRVAPIGDALIKDRIAQLYRENILAIFTSVAAVKAVADSEAGQPSWQIACLEGATLDAVTAFWGNTAICCTAADAATLAQKINSAGNTNRPVFFCGNRRRDELPDFFKNAGKAIEEVVVYQTIETASRVEKHYDGILFLSPSAVTSFFSLNSLSPLTTAFAIGSTTAACIWEYTEHNVIISPKHSQEALIHQLIAYYRNEK